MSARADLIRARCIALEDGHRPPIREMHLAEIRAMTPDPRDASPRTTRHDRRSARCISQKHAPRPPIREMHLGKIRPPTPRRRGRSADFADQDPVTPRCIPAKCGPLPRRGEVPSRRMRSGSIRRRGRCPRMRALTPWRRGASRGDPAQAAMPAEGCAAMPVIGRPKRRLVHVVGVDAGRVASSPDHETGCMPRAQPLEVDDDLGPRRTLSRDRAGRAAAGPRSPAPRPGRRR